MGRNIASYEKVTSSQLPDFLLGTLEVSGETRNFPISTILALVGTSGDFTRAEIQQLISENGLTPSSNYFITDASGGTRILVQAATNSTLFEACGNTADTSQIYIYNINSDTLTPYVSGSGVPDGGSIRQILTKKSNADGDADWEFISQLEIPNEGDLLFDNIAGYVTGSTSSPSSAASYDIKTTTTIDGVVNQIYYQGATLPSFTGDTVVNFTPDNFVPNELCLLTIIKNPQQYVLFVSAPNEPVLPSKEVTEGAYTLLSTDRATVLEFTNAGAVTVTIPENLIAGFTCLCVNNTGNVVTFVAGVGMTLNSEALNLETNNTAASIYYWTTNRAQVLGKLT